MRIAHPRIRIKLSHVELKDSTPVLPLPSVGEGRGEGERHTLLFFPLTQTLSHQGERELMQVALNPV